MSGFHPNRLFGEGREKIELSGGEHDLDAVRRGELAATGVENPAVETDRVGVLSFFLRFRLGGGAPAAQYAFRIASWHSRATLPSEN